MANVELTVVEGEIIDLQLTVPGSQGAVGPGVASGGASGQVLIKQSASDYDTAWGPVVQSMISGLQISNDDIAANAGIADSKLATISSAGKVANSATTATSAGLVNTIVQRDAAGGFSAGVVTVTGLTIIDKFSVTKDFSIGSGLTVSGNAAVSGALIVASGISGNTFTGNSGSFAVLSGVTTAGTSAVFASGIFSSQVSGAAIIGSAITETVNGTQYPVLSSYDIGTDPDKVPINAYLGQLAFLDEVSRLVPAATVPTSKLNINFEYVSDTSIKIRMKGSDGVVRSATLTLS